MKSLADITELIQTTTKVLMNGSEEQVAAKAGIELIDQWVVLLSESENTLPIASQLTTLKELITVNHADSAAIVDQMGKVAAKVLILTSETGSEGPVPSLLAALAAALRMSAVYHNTD